MGISEQERLDQFKLELTTLSNKYEADVVAIPQWIQTDNGFKIGAVLNIINKQNKQNEQIQDPSEKNREKKQAK